MSLLSSEDIALLSDLTYLNKLPGFLFEKVITLFSVKKFSIGEIILNQNQTNSILYILKSGKLDILVDNERITHIETPGEPVGDISAILGRTVTASIVAATDVELIFLDLESLADTRIEYTKFIQKFKEAYIDILVERIIRINEKAKLLGEVSRKLSIVQEQLRMTKLEYENQLKSNQMSLKKKSVLFCDAIQKDQALAKLAFGGTGVEVKVANTENEFDKLINNSNFDLLFCEMSLADNLLNKEIKAEQVISSKSTKNKTFSNQIDKTVLMVRPTGDSYFGDLKKYINIPNVITIAHRNRNSTIKNIVTSVNKILYHDLFGLEKYLMWGVEVNSEYVVDSDNRHVVNSNMVKYFKQMGVRTSILDRVYSVAEEMLMNAIYDAPVDKNGKPIFNHLPRTQKITLEEKMRPTLRYATDGLSIAFSVEDPFGCIKRETILKYLHDCSQGKIQMDVKEKAGAGRGLYQMVMLSDDIIFNIEHDVKTEVISVIQLELERDSEKFPRISYFYK